MSTSKNDVDSKVQQIFRELVGERAEQIRPDRLHDEIISKIAAAHCNDPDNDEQFLESDELGLHMVDWNSDAAFIVALSLFPERFSDEEVREGVRKLLMHVPYHLVNATRICRLHNGVD